VQTWSAIAVADARYAEDGLCDEKRDLVGDEALRFMRYHEHVTTGDYVQVQLARERGHQAYVDRFTRTGAAVLLTPALGCDAFSHGANHPSAIGGVAIAAPWSDWCGFPYDANLAGLPACAVRVNARWPPAMGRR
jgi:hypothetical protein